MSCDFTTAFARLLSDGQFRERFLADRGAAVAELTLSAADRELLFGLEAEDLEAQARTLLHKRLSEVARLLPVTFKRMGSAARELFLRHASTFWPEGHQRHLTDAVQFGRLLLRLQIPELCLAEYHRAQFALTQRRLSFRFVRDYCVRGRPKRVLQILYRDRTARTRQLIFYFGL